MRRVWQWCVRGSGGFPFEMLYQCECWPATLIDAEKITLACPTQAPEQQIFLLSHREVTAHDRADWAKKKWPVFHMSSS